MNGYTLFLDLLFSLVGCAYFLYGKKQGEFWCLGAGAGLMLFPYFVSGAWSTLLAGVVLAGLPFAARRWWD